MHCEGKCFWKPSIQSMHPNSWLFRPYQWTNAWIHWPDLRLFLNSIEISCHSSRINQSNLQNGHCFSIHWSQDHLSLIYSRTAYLLDGLLGRWDPTPWLPSNTWQRLSATRVDKPPRNLSLPPSQQKKPASAERASHRPPKAQGRKSILNTRYLWHNWILTICTGFHRKFKMNPSVVILSIFAAVLATGEWVAFSSLFDTHFHPQCFHHACLTIQRP